MEHFVQHLGRYLFVGTELNVFAVLDGASIPDLQTSLHTNQPEYACLYRGVNIGAYFCAAPRIWQRFAGISEAFCLYTIPTVGH